MFEFGLGQEVEVEALLRASSQLAFVDLKRDLQGISRTAIARRT
jgi:methylase of polypeptide subunit release factors